MTTMKQAHTYLVEHAPLFGFAGYNIEVVDKTDECPEQGAQTQVLSGAKLLIVTLYEDWDQMTGRDWKNILLHELIHARIGTIEDDFRERTKELRYHIEEDAVNDIAYGVRLLAEKKRR